MIYVEHHDGPEQTEIGRIDLRPGWYAICDDCGWSAGPCRNEADAHAAADAHDLAMGEASREELERQQRPGERVSVAWQASHGRRADGWWFAVEVPGRPREEHGPFTSEAGMLAAKVARMQELEAPPSERPAEPGSCVPAAARPSSSTSAACSGRPATAASPTAATRPGRARSAAAPATRKAAARTTGSASTSTDHRDPMEDLMNLRLHGTPAECEAAAARLRRTPGMSIQDESRPYPDRSGELVRIYLTVDLDPTSSGQPGQPATGGEGRQR